MNIWLIQHGEPLPVSGNATPFRTARLSKELASRGHSVTYWCSSFYHHKKTLYCETSQAVPVDGYTLNILHAGSYKTNHSASRYRHHRKMAALFAAESRKMVPPDVIVAGLPIHDCAYEAVEYAEPHGIPVIVDIRDYWPDNYLRLLPKALKWLGRVIFGSDFRKARIALTKATSLVSMMSEMLGWAERNYTKRALTDADRVFLIGGDRSSGDQAPNVSRFFPDLEERVQGRFVITYIGSFSFLNHPMSIVEAARELNARGHGDELLFLLAGTGDYYDRCVKAAEGLANVIFLGWVDADAMAALSAVTSAGVIPSYEEFSFPNKAFSYSGGGLPILSSEHGDLHRLLMQYQAGLHFDISSRTDLAEKILEISQLSPEKYAAMSKNARALFADHFDADAIYRAYADHVENVATSKPRALSKQSRQ